MLELQTHSDAPNLTSSATMPTPGSEAPHLCEEDLRNFYDPADRYPEDDIQTFLSRVALTRGTKQMTGFGEISGHEVILAESAHALMDGSSDIKLPIPDSRQVEIVEAVQDYAGAVALSAIEVADSILAERTRRTETLPGVRWAELPPQFVVAGKVLAAVAHDGDTRRSGRPYYSHPDEVASILTTAWRKNLKDDEEVGGANLRIIQFLCYLHDGYEDTIDPFGNYLEDDVIVTPLVAQKVLEHYDITDAERKARALLYLTRTRDVEKNRMPYQKYTQRGIRKGGLLYILPKSPDNRHNTFIEPDLINPEDPKAQAKLQKREQYLHAEVELKNAADEYGEPAASIVHSVFGVTKQEVKDTIKYPIDIQRAAHQVRLGVAGRLSD